MRTAIFWIVGLACLAFNCFALYDLTMTLTNPADHLAGFPEPFVEMLLNLPQWRIILWTTTVFIGIIGSAALLLHRVLAERALWAATILIGVGFIIDLTMFGGIEAYGPFGMVPIIIIEGLFALYARYARRQGILR